MKKRRYLGVAGAMATITLATASQAAATPPVTPVGTQPLSLSHAQQYAGNIGTGPSTSISPYLLPVQPGIDIVSLLSVHEPGVSGAPGTAPAGYPTMTAPWNGMVGIPDGIGAYKDSNGDIVTLVNHELGSSSGAVRLHGQKGAFVSRLTIDPSTLQVKTAQDLIDAVQYWDYATSTYGLAPTGSFTAAFARFCSGFLAEEAQLFNSTTGNGFAGKIYMANEEQTNGRLFGVDVATGDAIQLPRTGLFGWENTILGTTGTDTTLLLGNDDSTPSAAGGYADAGFLRLYEGTKTNTGTFADKAGLTNGTLYTLKISDTVFTDKQFRDTIGKYTPTPVSFVTNDWTANTTAAQNSEAKSKASMAFWRIDDGAFDPRPGKENTYYFLTTQSQDSTNQRGALWKLEFNDMNDPSAGGVLTMILDGNESTGLGDPLTSPDNMAIDGQGHVLIQEDPGSTMQTTTPGGNYPDGRNDLARMFAYDLDTQQLVQLAQFDRSKFDTSPNGTSTGAIYDPAAFLTRDEESSGVLDAGSLIGPGWFLLDAQVHTTNTVQSPASSSAPDKVTSTEVENGQLMAMKIDWTSVFEAGPAPVVPEAPVTVLLTLLGGATLAGGIYLMHRRNSALA